MGPKKGGAAEPPAAEKKEGSNICYISIPLKLSEEDTSSIDSTMNTNCRVDIILDNARRSLLKIIQTQEKTPQPAPLDPLPLPVAEEGAEEGDAAPEPVEDTRPDPIEAWRVRMERLSVIKEKLLAAAVTDLELFNEAAVNIQQNLEQNGTEVLAPSTKYSIGVLVGEEEKVFEEF